MSYCLQKDNIDIFLKPIVPIVNDKTSYAILVLNRRTDGMPRIVDFNVKDIGLDNDLGYMVQVRIFLVISLLNFFKKKLVFQNVYDLSIPVLVKPSDKISVKVNPTGNVAW